MTVVLIDIYFDANSNGGLKIDDCKFLNESYKNHDYSVYMLGMEGIPPSGVNIIRNTIWNHYYALNSVIYIAASDNGIYHYFLNNKFGNIQGRAIHTADGVGRTLNVNNNTFYNIIAGGDGAAIYVNGQSALKTTTIINRTRFEKCSSCKGAIYLTNPGEDTILEQLTFIDNEASCLAADLYVESTDYLTLWLTDPSTLSPGPHTVIGSRITAFSYEKQASSIFIGGDTRDGTFQFVFDSWTFINCSGSENSANQPATIYLEGTGGIFTNNIFRGNGQSGGGGIIRWNSYGVDPPYFNFTGNIFENNHGIDSIFYYEPSVYDSGSIIRFVKNGYNIFDNNDGGIINELVFNTDASKGGLLEVYDIIIRNYNHTINPSALFALSSSEIASDCSVSAPASIEFDGISFTASIDTQLIVAECVSTISITNIALSDNIMPTLTINNAPISSTPIMEFGRLTTRVSASTWQMNNNQGVLLRNSDGIIIENHHVSNHQGIYYLFDHREDKDSGSGVGLSTSNFSNCNVTNGFSDFGLITMYGKPYNLYNETFSFDQVYFQENEGSLIFISPTQLTLDVPQTHCVYTTSGSSFLRDVTFSNNYVNTGHLVAAYGVSMIFADGTIFRKNKCINYACLGLYDGWYTIADFSISSDIDSGFIIFGHDPLSVSKNEIQLCINSTNAPGDIYSEYLSLSNLDTMVYNERVTFLPLPCQEISTDSSLLYASNTEYLTPLIPRKMIFSKVLHIEPGDNILNNVTCIEENCEMICNGSVVKYLICLSYIVFIQCISMIFRVVLDLHYIVIQEYVTSIVVSNMHAQIPSFIVIKIMEHHP